MEFFTPPFFLLANPKVSKFQSPKITTHPALLFHLLGIMQRAGTRARFDLYTVRLAERFFREILCDPSDGIDRVADDEADYFRDTLPHFFTVAAIKEETVRYSAALIALFLDAQTYSSYYDQSVDPEIVNFMALGRYGVCQIDVKVTRKLISGKLNTGNGRKYDVTVPIKRPWHRGPLWN